jgi:predicted AlkP superfamily phosphohydrolase/phosphomutase/tetratricopeptide (TPR) repeat protein
MTTRRKVLLVGWDAADWKVIRPLIAAGQMPHLARLIDGGVSGNLATLYPALSPMLWSSIATGKRPGKHGIHGFTEPVPGGGGIRPISSLSRTAKAVWNILNQNDLRSVVVGWWPSHPAEPLNGVMVSDFFHKAGDAPEPIPLATGAVHPHEWFDRLTELRVTPMELPGEVLRLFVPDYLRVDQEKDKRLHTLARMVAEAISTHAAATEILEHTEWDFAAIYQDAVDHFCHGFMGYHPPRLPWISEEDFVLYQHVVANCYRYHDAMLGRLLQLAGPESTVIVMSDHGFHSDAHRTNNIPAEMAGPAVEHRHFGILCMNGPGIKRGEPIFGSVILDIAPTLLHLFGLPIGEDMDGKVLVNALVEPGKVQTLPSWEAVPGESGQHAAEVRLDPVAAAEAMKQLIALGYIAPPPDNVQEQIRQCVTELKYNLARAYDDESRYDQSVPLYEAMLAADPDEHRASEHLFHALLRTGRIAEARKLLAVYDAQCVALAPKAMAALEERITARPNSELDTMLRPEDKREVHERQKLREQAGGYVLQRALLHFLLESQAGTTSEMRQSFAALEALCERTGAQMPTTLVARRFARNRDSARALALVRKALAADPDDWQALTLGAQLQLEGKRYPAALEMAMRSLSLVYHQPLMHYVMGHCLMGQGDYGGAEQPLRIAVSQSPGFTKAHELLSRLYADHLDRPREAALHYVNAEQLKKTRREKRQRGPEEEPSVDELEGEDAPMVRPVFPHRAGSPTPAIDREVLIVCGLPRSGTSMLMQLLVAGGVSPLTDGVREADSDNPRGYYEYERATHLHEDKAWLPEARGKVVKLVLPLVPFLPRMETYRLLLIQRDLSAVVASQERMLERLGRTEAGANLTAEALMREYCSQEHRVLNWLEARPGIAILPLDYDAILRDPHGTTAAIAAFLGRTFDVATAAQAVDPTLKRQGERA